MLKFCYTPFYLKEGIFLAILSDGDVVMDLETIPGLHLTIT